MTGASLAAQHGRKVAAPSSQVKQRRSEPDRRRVLQRDYTTLVAQEDFAAYLSSLRKRYKVEINQAALESKER